MMGQKRRAGPDLLETAGEWALRAEVGLSRRDAERLVAWLAAAPGHRAAYDSVLEADRMLTRHGADAEMMALRAAALRARPEGGWTSMRTMAASLIAAAFIAGGIGVWGIGQHPELSAVFGLKAAPAARYVTAQGERATITLEDGSVLALNADSVAEVNIDRRSRTVRLEKGQALFTVAHDTSRPFEVFAGGRRVTAVGTAFDVLVLPGALRVAMLDGVVRVSADERSAQTLSRGEVMTVQSSGSTTVRKADTVRMAAWRDGVVYFEETPLSDAVAEMNRYARHPTVLADQDVGALRVSGAFRITEAEDFAAAMADIFSLTVKRSADGRTTLARAGV